MKKLLVFCLASLGGRGYGTSSADILEDVGRKDDKGVLRRFDRCNALRHPLPHLSRQMLLYRPIRATQRVLLVEDARPKRIVPQRLAGFPGAGTGPRARSSSCSA